LNDNETIWRRTQNILKHSLKGSNSLVLYRWHDRVRLTVRWEADFGNSKVHTSSWGRNVN
jgi:hypothetical protein